MKLYKHQQKALDFIINHNYKAGVFYEMGLGKTIIALSAFLEFRKNVNPRAKMIVLCPISIIESSWVSDVKKFTKLNPCNARKEYYDNNSDVIIFNYESLLSKRYDGFRHLCEQYMIFLVIDESSRIKNRTSKTYRQISINLRHFRGLLVMSGTPAPNVELEYFSQIKLLSPEILGNFYAFQARFFHLVRGKQILPCSNFGNGEQLAQGFRLKLKPFMKQELFRLIGQVGIFAKKEDCLDLPEKIFMNRIIEMTPDQSRVYKELNKSLYTELKNGTEIAVQMAITKLMKLRQVTSGFIYDSESQAQKISDQKLNELMDTLDDIGPNEQVVIFAQFKHEIALIVDELRKREKTVDFLNSETNDKDTTIELFKANQVQYLVCHPKTAGMGLNFQFNSSNMVWYSLSYSYAEYSQACDRIHRIGQSKSCTYIHLICNNSIDEILLQVLEKKGEAQDAIFEYLKKEESKYVKNT